MQTAALILAAVDEPHLRESSIAVLVLGVLVEYLLSGVRQLGNIEAKRGVDGFNRSFAAQLHTGAL